MKKHILAVFISLFVAATPLFSFAENSVIPTKEQISSSQQDIKNIEEYLNQITTFVANFKQVDSEDQVATGTFYLSRPGRLRWDYNSPTPILIIAKGSLLSYYDKELQQISHVGIDDSLSVFLTKKVISFSDDTIEITKFEKKDSTISVTIAQKGKPENGKLTLIFKADKIELNKMIMLDAVGKTTTVSFEGQTYDKPLEKELFAMPHVDKERVGR